jgi:anti-sigma regulatory factor (Ser/Thr protein kinase)
MTPVGADARTDDFESVTTVFPAAPPSAANARRFVGGALERWGVPEEVTEVGLLLTSELVTNSYRHASCDAQVSVVRRPGMFRVEVRDSGGGRVQRRALDPTQPDGRGLNIVDALATRWGSAASESGTLVWFELPLSDR